MIHSASGLRSLSYRHYCAQRKEALLFLLVVDEPGVAGVGFAGYTPRALSRPDSDLIIQVKQEIKNQQVLLSQFENVFSPEEEALYGRVRDLVDATTRKDSQMAAFRELEELGSKAVPAIIMLMDDRRDLAIPEISFRNSPGIFEGIRHYGPTKVVDAMDAILNQVTGTSFGNISNSGTERERREAVNGWRVYLYHQKNEAHAK